MTVWNADTACWNIKCTAPALWCHDTGILLCIVLRVLQDGEDTRSRWRLGNGNRVSPLPKAQYFIIPRYKVANSTSRRAELKVSRAAEADMDSKAALLPFPNRNGNPQS